MQYLKAIEELEPLYGPTSEGAQRKGSDHLTPLYMRWVSKAKFCVMATVGTEGTDASPRGDDGPVVRIQDPKTLLMPDWRGNNRIDSLRNILEDGRVSLMFMVSGIKDVVRVNGCAQITANETLCQSFSHGGHSPRCVIEIAVKEVYIHCPKSVIRSNLWQSDILANVPTIGDILKEVTKDGIGGKKFDKDLAQRTQTTLWS